MTGILFNLREKLQALYSEIGRPSIDPELMIRMLIVGYCYAIRGPWQDKSSFDLS